MFDTIVVLMLAAAGGVPGSSQEYLPQDTLSRIETSQGLTAFVLCSGIPGADGLALSPEGVLYAVSESSGTLYEIDPVLGKMEILSGLDHPEGLSWAGEDCVLVTEDTGSGRVLLIDGSGEFRTVAQGLLYPEGVVMTSSGHVLATESSAETGSLPPFETSIIDLDTGETLFEALFLWSLSDLTLDEAGTVYACNELSGLPLVDQSVIRVNPRTGEWDVFVRGLTSCEGICHTPGSFFPMLVAEEDTGGGRGRVVSVDSLGRVSEVASGFYNIEDVAVDAAGRIFVSEDTSGMIIMLSPEPAR